MPPPVADPFAEWTGWQRVRADQLPLTWSAHALGRYAERLAHQDVARVRELLSRMLASATVTRTRPAWVVNDTHAVGWLTFGDDVAMPLAWRDGELVATTTLHRGMISPSHRRKVNAQKQRQRAGKRGRRHVQSHHDHRPPRLPSLDDE